jgi:hypothetical protein
MMVGEKGYGNYWDARRRPNFSPKIQQEFIESVRIILILSVLRGGCALHLPSFDASVVDTQYILKVT